MAIHDHFPANCGQTLHRESRAPADDLIQVHDILSQSRDSSMQYIAAWAMLYLSQKDNYPDADEAFDVAVQGLARVSEEPLVKVYDETTDDVPMRAAFALSLAQQIRNPRVEYTPEQRIEVYQSFEPLLRRGIDDIAAEDKSGNGTSYGQGSLSELAIGALFWRPTPKTFSVLNAVPAGPAKDSRPKGMTQFATDQYIYHPTIESTRKGRVNAQIKTTIWEEKKDRYDQDAIMVIGLNEDICPPNGEEWNGRQARDWLVETLLKDIQGEQLTAWEEEALFDTMADLYDRVVSLASDKVERSETRRLERIAAAQ